ncbi:MAG: TonB-dependent receptor [Bacteroidetes bacterium]|nr:TonB-dependent receptor [Bacteroidota bacterium]MCH8522916.1 TonB-dependent receptor [Balneolales bacterium]
MKKYILLYIFAVLTGTAWAQSPDTLRADLNEIRIEASRGQTPLNDIPFSVSSWQRTESQRLGSPQPSFASTFEGIPGIYFGNRDNFSLGERLSIRGMGWRASFGVRGIQVLLNGIPLTSPDGQTILEVVDPNLIRQAEFIRGPNAIYWGNGSGGTLYMNTMSQTDGVSLRAYGGSFGTNGQDVSVATSLQNTRIQADVSRFTTSGYREHSSATLNRFSLTAQQHLGSSRYLRYTGFAAVAPESQNPGSLTAGELSTNRTLANPRSVSQDAGKAYTHIMQGIQFVQERDNDRFEAVLHGTIRDLSNPIQPVIIEINRLSGGARINYERTLGQFSVLVASDWSRQHDIRQNWSNQEGSKGNQTVRQFENAQTIGLAGIIQADFGALSINGGLRQDWIEFRANNRFSSDPSSTRSLSAFSPQLGFTYETKFTATFFGSINTSFETPTLTELAVSPTEEPGLNPFLEPEESTGYELGVRGFLPSLRLRYELAAYHINVRSRLLAFQTDLGGDRNFFVNAGRARHRGIESALSWRNEMGFFARASISLQDVTIRSNEGGLQGNKIPGIPSRIMNTRIGYENDSIEISGLVRNQGMMYTNNANTVENDSWTTLDIRNSYRYRIASYGTEIQPFVQISNVLDERYNSSVVINAFGGRYFEPSLPRSLSFGVAVTF